MLEDSDFVRWLWKGHGRAASLIRERGAAALQEDLLYACRHHLIFDPQENDRAFYIWQLIGLTGEKQFYRARVLDALSSVTPDDVGDDGFLPFGLALRLAQEGDSEARGLLKETLARVGPHDLWAAWVDHYILLEGIGALRMLAAWPDEDPGYPVSRFEQYLEVFEESRPPAEAKAILQSASAEDTVLAERLREAAEFRAKRASATPLPERIRSYAQWKEALVQGGSSLPLSWLRTVSASDLREVADDFCAEQDATRLDAYLRLFGLAEFPLPPDRLLELAGDAESTVSRRALHALANVSHPAVRAFALELAEHPSLCGSVPSLLARNAAAGDHEILDRLLSRIEDDEVLHHYFIGLKAHLGNEPKREFLPLIREGYERCPCSLCRTDFVIALKHLGALDEATREECKYDADASTRNLVGGPSLGMAS